MIAHDQILKLATQYQTSELNVMREYLQNLFLSYFYQQSETDSIYFKGGTALRLIYRSPRFSKDLDFSTNRESVPEIEGIILEVLGKIEAENIKTNLSDASPTTGGYIAVIDFGIYEQTIPIQIEISFREQENQGELTTVTSDFIPPYAIIMLEEAQLVSQKIRALLSRQKPRDFYDLYFILRKQLPIRDKGQLLPEVLRLLCTSDINFEIELKQFLPKSHWLVIRDFKSNLEKEIERFI